MKNLSDRAKYMLEASIGSDGFPELLAYEHAITLNDDRRAFIELGERIGKHVHAIGLLLDQAHELTEGDLLSDPKSLRFLIDELSKEPVERRPSRYAVDYKFPSGRNAYYEMADAMRFGPTETEGRKRLIALGYNVPSPYATIHEHIGSIAYQSREVFEELRDYFKRRLSKIETDAGVEI